MASANSYLYMDIDYFFFTIFTIDNDIFYSRYDEL